MNFWKYYLKKLKFSSISSSFSKDLYILETDYRDFNKKFDKKSIYQIMIDSDIWNFHFSKSVIEEF